MPALGIDEPVWSGLRPNQRLIMRLAFVKLSLGTSPARYLDTVAVEVFIFDDTRLDELMYARLGTLANQVAGLPVGWTPPQNPDGTIDRAALEAEVIARVQASIVCPEDIDYAPDGAPVKNRWDHTLKSQVPPAPAAMAGWGAVPVEYVALGSDPDG